MSSKLEVRNEILIDASPENVWEVLTKPEQTKKYMYGCESITDWQEGSSLIWRGEYEGQAMDFVSGTVKQYDKPNQLCFTVIDPNDDMPKTPENHLDVKYSLETIHGKTKLEVVQDGFENAAKGQKRYEDVYNNGLGWQPILDQIKKIAEELS